MASRLLIKLSAVQNAAAFGVAGGEHDAPDPRKRNRGGAHRAGLQRDVKIVFGDALRAGFFAHGADRQNFGVGGWVAARDGFVAGLGRDFPGLGMDQDRADRHFVHVGGAFSLFQSEFHEIFVGPEGNITAKTRRREEFLTRHCEEA